jgi:hypothetical protein
MSTHLRSLLVIATLCWAVSLPAHQTAARPGASESDPQSASFDRVSGGLPCPESTLVTGGSRTVVMVDQAPSLPLLTPAGGSGAFAP